MAQYNDLFGFDRFAQAQNMARQWEREREQDMLRREQMMMQQEAQRGQNALAQLQMQREGQTQNALRLGIENQPYLETLRSDPALYNEALAVNRQDMLRYNPGSDVAAVAKFGDRMEAPKVEAMKYTERDKPVGKNLFQREYRDETTGGKWLPLGERYEKNRGTQISIGGGKTLPAGQLESLADMEQVKRQLADAKKIIDSGKVDTGPVSGRFQSIATKLGGASPEFVQLKQKLSTAENIMLKLRSGAAVTQSEYERFLNEYPNVNDSPEVAKTKAANAVKYASELLNLKIETYKEGGYKTPQNIGMGQEVAPGITILSIEDAP